MFVWYFQGVKWLIYIWRQHAQEKEDPGLHANRYTCISWYIYIYLYSNISSVIHNMGQSAPSYGMRMVDIVPSHPLSISNSTTTTNTHMSYMAMGPT